MASSDLKKIIALLLSIILYLIYGNCFIPILLTSFITFHLGKVIKRKNSIYLVGITYLIILMPLVFYKYLIKIMDINLLMPLGISYYTLGLISYISDIYHKRCKPSLCIVDFLLFSLYFPCLFIGPINKYNEFIKKINKIKFDKENVFSSLFRVSVGLIKKFIIANKLSVIILSLSANTSYTGLYVLFGLFIYSIFLYCDFSGGIDIVLGVSKIFNIDLVENFNKPFLSQTVKEFWQRWHISLGTWLKDYIYIPMGGNRNGSINTKINIIFTFFISGIWHGLHYILWGVINGILVAINFKTNNRYLNIVLTFITISFLWIFFIYDNTLLSLEMFGSIFKLGSFNIWNFGLTFFDYLIIIIFLIFIVIYEINIYSIKESLNKISFNKKLFVLLSILLLLLIFGNYGLDVNSNNFIYGNF